ncbi:DsbA family protein [Haloglycomyces albus]|uniref:DsbA family protein n=1 Tax=Haloglycomyces albus TaxID=526067 RepID=UPI00054E40C9|nr:ETRAMP family protein [Haloglycomyces albus]
MSTNSRRQAVAAMQQQQAAEKRRKTILFSTVVTIAIVLIGGLIGLGIYLNSGDDENREVVNPETSTTDDYGLVLGDGPVTLDLYVDFQCPVCKQFESEYGEKLIEWVENEDVTLNYHILNFLDSNQNSEFSSRAGNAVINALETGDDIQFLEYAQDVFHNQPEEGSGKTLTNSQLITIAEDYDFGSEFEDGVNDEKYVGWIDESNDSALDRDDISGTPTLFINGEKVSSEEMADSEALIAQIESDIESAK